MSDMKQYAFLAAAHERAPCWCAVFAERFWRPFGCLSDSLVAGMRHAGAAAAVRSRESANCAIKRRLDAVQRRKNSVLNV